MTAASVSFARTFVRRLGVVAGLVVVLVGAVLLLLRFDPFATAVVRTAVGLALPAGTGVTVVRAEIVPFSGRVSIDSLAIRRPGGDTAIAVPRLELTMNPAALRHRRLDIRRLRLDEPRVSIARGADSAWFFLAPPETAASEPPSGTAWLITIGQLRIDGGEVRARMGPDSVHRASGLAVRASGLRLGPTSRGVVDSLGATLTMAGHPDRPGALQAAGRWNEDRLVIDTLAATTASSRITGGGTIPLAAPGAGDVQRFRLTASPLALDELTDFVPAIGGPPAELVVEGRAATGGRLAVTGSLHLGDGGSARFDARLGDSAGVPRLASVGADLDGLDPGALLTASGADGAIDAHLTFDLGGSSLRRASGTARLTLAPSRIGGLDDLRGSVTARAVDGRVTFSTDLEGRDLTLTADGEFDPGDEEPAYSIDGRIGGPPLGGGTIRFRGGGAGLPPDGVLQLTGESDSISLGSSGPVTATLEARLEADSLRLDLAAQVAAGSLAVRVVGRPFETPRSFAVRRGRVDGLDLRTFLPAGPSTSLSGNLEGSFRLADRPTGALAITLDTSRIGYARLAQGEVRAELDGERLTVDGNLALDRGSVALAAHARPFDHPISYEVTRAETTDLDLAALLGRAGWPSSVTGTVALTGSGVDPATRRLGAELVLDSSMLADVTVDSARVRGSLLGDSVSVDGHAVVGGGRFELAGGGRLGDSLATRRGAATLSLGTIAWREVTVDSGLARVRFAAGKLTVDTLDLRSNVLALAGAGGVAVANGAAPDTLRVEATVTDLGPVARSYDLAEMTAGSGSATVVVAGPARDLVLTGRGRVDALRYGTVRLVGIEATVDGGGSATGGVDRGVATVTLDRLVLPTATVERTEATARLAADRDLRVEVVSRVDETRTISVAARLDRLADGRVWTIEQADAEIADTRWTLRDPARLRADDVLSVDRLVLDAPGRRIELAGTLDSAGTRDLRMAIDSFPVETVADLAGFEQVRGSLSGTLELTGTAGEPTGRVALGFAAIDRDGGHARLDLDGRLQRTVMTVEGSITRAEHTAARVKGEVPWPLSRDDGRLALALDADSVRLVLLEPFVDPTLARGFGGRVAGHVDVSGSPDDPQLSGSLRLVEGRVQLPALGVRWEHADLTAALAGNTVTLSQGTITSDGGTVRARGEIELRRLSLGELDLTLTADEFRAIRSDTYHAVVSGEVKVVGTTRAPAIRGTVDVLEGDVYLGDDFAADEVEQVTLGEDDYRDLETYFGFPVRHPAERMIPTIEELTLDLTARLGRDTWLRQNANPELAVQLSGELQIRKRPGPAMQLVGTLSTISERSYVTQFGRRFALREGQLVFQGDRFDTRVDLEAAYTVPSRTDPEPEAVIILGITGTVGDLGVVLSSEPAMSNGDIVSYLATGRPAGQALAVGDGGGGGLATTGTGLALDQAAGVLEGLAADRVGLDVIEIERNGLDGATLVAGRYVSPQLYLGFKQPIALRGEGGAGSGRDPRTEVEVELQAYRWLLLNFASGGDALQFFLRARHGY